MILAEPEGPRGAFAAAPVPQETIAVDDFQPPLRGVPMAQSRKGGLERSRPSRLEGTATSCHVVSHLVQSGAFAGTLRAAGSGAFWGGHAKTTIPDAASKFTINALRRSLRNAPSRRSCDERLLDKVSPRCQTDNRLWLASKVAKESRLRFRTNGFAYPGDDGKRGKLRLMSKANPMICGIEQAARRALSIFWMPCPHRETSAFRS